VPVAAFGQNGQDPAGSPRFPGPPINHVKILTTAPEMNRLSAALASWVIALKWSRENRARVSYWHVPVQAFSWQWAPLTPSRSTSRGLPLKNQNQNPHLTEGARLLRPDCFCGTTEGVRPRKVLPLRLAPADVGCIESRDIPLRNAASFGVEGVVTVHIYTITAFIV
jgi:hypothetical protein